jgi:hypothetical protein
MSKGILMVAQNSADDYVLQACLCAMSIKATNDVSVSILTNDPVPDKYKELFEHIISIPWTDSAKDENWKVQNRWKAYHVTPYDETIVMDTDMLVLQNIDSWWNFLSNYEMYFTSHVMDYRQNVINDTYYRKAFTSNKLPNVYVGIHYFKKCDFAHDFYGWLELVSNNWNLFYGHYVKEHYPKRMSIDVSAAIVTKILDCEPQITNAKAAFPTFTHMKPHLQGWKTVTESWQERVGVYLKPNLDLMVGNHKQDGVFHYTENNFVTNKIIKTYEEALCL